MISISIVSHGHGEMVWSLVRQVLNFSEVSRIILTINITEHVPEFDDPKIEIVYNSLPKGFGANHNAAFDLIESNFFCVLNPDITFEENPFAHLIKFFENPQVGLVAPMVLAPNGTPEDSMRHFLTPWSMIKRILRINNGAYVVKKGSNHLNPDWVAGMFMLFCSKAYRQLNGFDEKYFMYCEDADICARLWKAKYTIIGCLSTCVIHGAQRASHRSFRHLSWHIYSMARYFLNHAFVAISNK